ncbi:hypothetical protein HID58_034769 [Brassica napus]|uniref:Uncharacterized protein n=1 Tax=Brassica napus TaxID=3708 RepID=A0ABQ8C377_BRANA|nr:hypothetical protein HID58_034769 [Brassica napus]
MKTVSVLVFFFLFFLMPKARSKNLTHCVRTFSCGSLDFRHAVSMRSVLDELQCSRDSKKYSLRKTDNVTMSVSQANTITVTDPRLKQSLETGSCSDSISFYLPDSPWLDLTTLYKSNNSRRKNGFTYPNCKGRRSTCITLIWEIFLGVQLSRHQRASLFLMLLSLFIYTCLQAASAVTIQAENNQITTRRVSSVLTVMIIIVVVLILVIGKNARKSDWSADNVEAVLAKVKKMTSSFAHVLGKGGFGNITKEEERIAKKMLLVGLWCIQTNPSDLTPMIKVIEMLEGNLETVQIPSKPLFCLPTATVPETLEDSHGISSCSKPSKFGRHAYSLSF